MSWTRAWLAALGPLELPLYPILLCFRHSNVNHFSPGPEFSSLLLITDQRATVCGRLKLLAAIGPDYNQPTGHIPAANLQRCLLEAHKDLDEAGNF